MTAQVRLVAKAARSGNLGQWIALRNEFARVIEAHQKQVLMRRVTGKLPKHECKMAAAHLRHGSKFGQRDLVREIGLQALDSVADARRNRRGSQPPAVLIAHRAKYSQRQSAG